LRTLYPEVYVGHADYAYAFLALSLRLLREGAAMGFVLPRTVLDGASGMPLRRLLGKHGVRSIIDFRAAELFDILGYVCTVATGSARRVEVTSAQNAPIDGRIMVQEATTGKGPTLLRRWVSSSEIVQQATRGWSGFRLRWELELRAELAADLVPLVPSDSASRAAHYGTKPGAQTRFVVESEHWKPGRDDEIVVDGRRMPARFFPPLVRGPDITPFRLAGTNVRIFLPFESDGSLSADERIVQELARRGGLPKNVQRGNLRTLTAPKLLLRTLSAEPATAVDATGEHIPLMGTAGAIAIRLDDVAVADLPAYEGLLNSALYQWLLQGLGRPKHGGWTELTVGEVSALPVPILDAGQRAQLVRCATVIRAALEEERPMRRRTRYHQAFALLDEIVFEITGASPKVRATVENDGLHRPHFDALKWPHLRRLLVSG
jgi:hypothetical protein